MKKHFLSLFNPEHRRKTLTYFVVSVLLIIASQIVGVSDNLPGIAMLLGGMICLVYAFVHIWSKPRNFIILTWVSVGVVLLTFLTIYILSLLHKTEYISEGIVMGLIFLICLPGFIVGILGLSSRSVRKK